MSERLASSLRRRRVSLTALIDVIFLLLLFFMLSSTFARHGELALDWSGAGSATPTASDTMTRFLQIRDDALLLDTRPVTAGDLRQALDAERGGTLLVSVGRDVRAQQFADVLQALDTVQAWNIVIMESAP